MNRHENQQNAKQLTPEELKRLINDGQALENTMKKKPENAANKIREPRERRTK